MNASAQRVNPPRADWEATFAHAARVSYSPCVFDNPPATPVTSVTSVFNSSLLFSSLLLFLFLFL